jgi:hypothetical protein
LYNEKKQNERDRENRNSLRSKKEKRVRETNEIGNKQADE